MSTFYSAKTRRMQRNKFNLSHERKLSCKMADLVPIYLQEIIPSDKFSVNSEIFMRLAPMISPIMHRVNVTTHFFFVPNRIIWDNWKDFITGGEDGAADPVFPYINISNAERAYLSKGSLADYFGYPIISDTADVAGSHQINALPFRAYQSIFNEYYRDQNLQTKVDLATNEDGAVTNAAALQALRTRNWEKDYYTSCLPNAQKGDPVGIPVDFNYKDQSDVFDSAGGDALSGDLNAGGTPSRLNVIGTPARIENLEEEGVSVTVEQLRVAVRLQEWLEKNMRAGSRYVESIMAHFGARVPDYTADRPIYLGGGKQPVNISTTHSTYSGESANTHDLPQGNMSGNGISVGNTNKFSHKFTEHGFVIGIMSTLPRTAYQQAEERVWTKFDKFSYYWPEFSQLGEQEVKNSEIYKDFNDAVYNDGTFGYQSRYAEYKYQQSKVAGDMHDSLAHWHMGRIFNGQQALNEQFVQADPRKDIFAVTDPDVDNLYVQVYNNVQALRPIPKYNVPTL